MSSICADTIEYKSNCNCSYCGSANIQYKAKEDTIQIQKQYPYLCKYCYQKIPNMYGIEFYKKI